MSTETQRAEFCAFLRSIGWSDSPAMRENGNYINGSVQGKWVAWQAAQSSQAAEIEALKARLAAYEANGVTCQTFGHVVGACAECNTHEESKVAEIAALKADMAVYVLACSEQGTEIEALRRMLCAVYAGFSAYADDGECQDNSAYPHIDFLRDRPEQIEAKMRERAFARVANLQTKEAS